MARKTAFRFTVVRDPTIEAVLTRHAGARRFAYNQCLGMVKDALKARSSDESTKVPWTGFDLINAFNSWKTSEKAGRVFAVDSSGSARVVRVGLAWRQEVCAGVFKEAAVDLGRALGAFSASRRGTRAGRRVGFPRFQSKAGSRQRFRIRNKISRKGVPTVRVGVDRARCITLPIIGPVAVEEDTRRLRRLLRTGPDGVGRARIWSVTVSRHRGRWGLTVTLDAPEFHPGMRHRTDEGAFVGLDLGLSAFVVGARADGTELARVPSPAPLRADLVRVRRASRSVSRAKLGSRRRRKAVAHLGLVHARVADKRHDFHHRVSSQLVKTHDRLVMEDLVVANMVRNRPLARAISDAGWADFTAMLAYKADWYGTELVKAPRFFASSRICSACGQMKSELSLSERTYRCDSCGMVLDRDTNAAANLAAWAEAEVSSVAQVPDLQAGGRVNNVRGGSSAGHRLGGGGTGPENPASAGQKRGTGLIPVSG